jgi:hypothetical protein
VAISSGTVITCSILQKTEQMMELLKAMQERMETEIGSLASKMDTNQAKIDANLAKIITSHEQRTAKMDAWLAEMRAWQKEMTAGQETMDTCLESKQPTSLESIAVHEEVPKEAAVRPTRALKSGMGLASSHKAPRSAKETDPGQWWVLKEIGHWLQRDDPLCHSCTA